MSEFSYFIEKFPDEYKEVWNGDLYFYLYSGELDLR